MTTKLSKQKLIQFVNSNKEIEYESLAAMPDDVLRGNIDFADRMLAKPLEADAQDALLDVRNIWTAELAKREDLPNADFRQPETKEKTNAND